MSDDKTTSAIAGLREAFRKQIDAERAVDDLPPVTDAEYNAFVDELIARSGQRRIARIRESGEKKHRAIEKILKFGKRYGTGNTKTADVEAIVSESKLNGTYLAAANMFTTRDKNGDELEITCHAPEPGFTVMTKSGDGSDLDVYQAIALSDWMKRRIKEASEVELKAMIADDSINDGAKRNAFRAKYSLELECAHPESLHRSERGGHYCTTCGERV